MFTRQQITPLRRSVQRTINLTEKRTDRSDNYSYLLGNSPSLKGWSTVCMRSNGHWFPVIRKTPNAILSLTAYIGLFPPCYNHGIIRGYLLFDRLLKSIGESAYRHRYPEHGEEYAGIESFERSGKHFLYRANSRNFCPIAADCVISHNVWKANDASETEYLECGLEALVGERFKRSNFRKTAVVHLGRCRYDRTV